VSWLRVVCLEEPRGACPHTHNVCMEVFLTRSSSRDEPLRETLASVRSSISRVCPYGNVCCAGRTQCLRWCIFREGWYASVGTLFPRTWMCIEPKKAIVRKADENTAGTRRVSRLASRTRVAVQPRVCFNPEKRTRGQQWKVAGLVALLQNLPPAPTLRGVSDAFRYLSHMSCDGSILRMSRGRRRCAADKKQWPAPGMSRQGPNMTLVLVSAHDSISCFGSVSDL
jgi:hypothetical protein